MNNTALREEISQPSPLQTVGGRLKALRTKAKLTQCGLAIQSGTTAMHIMDIENGYDGFQGKLHDIAKALKCEPQWLKTGKNKTRATTPEPA